MNQQDDTSFVQKLLKLMTPDFADRMQVASLPESKAKALHDWGMWMYRLGQHTVSEIEDIKYEGRLIILADGSRWAVDSYDATTAEYWSAFKKVVVIANVMYDIENAEHVGVQQEHD